MLVTNDDGLDNDVMLARTKGPDRIEQRIGLFKGPLAIRPMCLEKVERIRAMVFLWLVALLVHRLLEQRARRAGLPLTGRTVLERGAVCSAVRTPFADGAPSCWPRPPPPGSRRGRTRWPCPISITGSSRSIPYQPNVMNPG